MIKVLICDDHAVVRQGLRTYLELQDDIEVVGEAADGQAAIDAARRTAPDVILLDLAMPDRDGLGALPQLKDLGRVIVLTSLRRGRPAVRGAARRRGRLPAQGHRAAGARARDPDGARGPVPALPRGRRARDRPARRRRAGRGRSTSSRRASARCCG